MPSLAERQQLFASALLDATCAVPAGLIAPHASVRDERFAVYRNNVAVGLIEALRSAFPVVERLVGREFFIAMARTHAMQSLPASPVLLAYGAEFPDFIARFEPAFGLPYLADVARLEWRWVEAYHAEEAEPLKIADLAGVARERLPALRLTLHPSARILQFAHPALRIWRAHEEEGTPAPLDLEEVGEAALVVRPGAHVEAIELSAGAFRFMAGIQAHLAVGEAVAGALDAQPTLNLGELLASLFSAGAFAGFSDGGAE